MSCRKIVLENVTIDLAGKVPRRLVDNLSLTVDAGRVLAIVGESGAGKSMTSLAIMGLLPPGIRRTGGEITIVDQPTARLDAEGWRRLRSGTVAMIMQNPMSAFDPVFTIGSHFHETIVSHEASQSAGEIRRRSIAALVEVGLPDPEAALDIYPFQMSGGMLQRVMIALALIGNPTFLIADEATTDLDVVSQARILHLLRERSRERHLGMVTITHDLSVAAFLADEVAVMQKGKLVEQAPVREIFANPKHPYTVELMDAHKRLYSRKFISLLHSLGAACEMETA